MIIVNLKIAPGTKTLAPKDLKRDPRKMPSFCTQYQNSMVRRASVNDDNMRVFDEFFVRGTLITDHSRHRKGGRDILITCEDESDLCTDVGCESDMTVNVFNNINTDLLMSLECAYEMDSHGRLPGDSRTPTPVARSNLSSVLQNVANKTTGTLTPTLLIPPGYRPLCVRTPSPSTRQIIRVDLTNKDNEKPENKLKEITYNVNRLKEKKGTRHKKII